MSVSYTHLQGMVGGYETKYTKALDVHYTFEAVSYTHLDVYKRQPFNMHVESSHVLVTKCIIYEMRHIGKHGYYMISHRMKL